ncbi:MAG: aminopeptidase P family protein [Oscillospiraceae bacterium]
MYKKLLEMLKNVDAVLLTSPHNMRYFSEFDGGEGYVLICKHARYVLVDSRYTEMATLMAKDFSVIEFSGNLFEKLQDIIKENNVKSIGFEDFELSFSTYKKFLDELKNVELLPLLSEIDALRMVKSPEEIAKMEIAEEIGVKAFLHILKYLKIGVSESDIATEIEYSMRKNGGSGTSFDTIVVSGAKSSLPHGKPDEKKLEYGDFVTMDFGCKYNGYCSDMTRTIVMGQASDEQKKIYNVVKDAQTAGLSAIRAGILGKDADTVARKVIEDSGYGKYFGHSLGHGVGLCIHELPNLSPKSEITLLENMVVTCEPGIYIPSFGGVRIEDMVVVKTESVVNLTKLSKELIEI